MSREHDHDRDDNHNQSDVLFSFGRVYEAQALENSSGGVQQLICI